MNKNNTTIDFILLSIENIAYTLQSDEGKFRMDWDKLDEVITEAKELYKKEMIDFASKMRVIKDVSSDGDVEFCFNIEENYKENYE